MNECGLLASVLSAVYSSLNAPPAREGQAIGLSARVEYDAKNCVVRSVRTEATFQGGHFVDERYFIRTARPTGEQAKDTMPR